MRPSPFRVEGPCVSKSRGMKMLLVLADVEMKRTARKGENTMATKRAGKPERKARDLSVKRLSTKQSERVKGGKRIILFLVPPNEIAAK